MAFVRGFRRLYVVDVRSWLFLGQCLVLVDGLTGHHLLRVNVVSSLVSCAGIEAHTSLRM